MNVFYKISIDRVNANYISGWCFHRLHPDRTVVLQCFQDEKLCAEAKASMFREDLKTLGLHPSGKCGFELIPGNIVSFNNSTPVSIRVKENGVKVAEISIDDLTAAGSSGYRLLKRWFRKSRKPGTTAIFMHIPKTAGTTFNTLAQKIYPTGSAITHIELLPEGRYSSLVEDHNFISGHLRFGRLKSHFNPDSHAFYTIIREPYAQLHSHLKWLIQTATAPDENYFRLTNQVIYNLGLKLERLNLANVDVLADFVRSLDDLEAAFVDNAQTRYFLERQPSRVGEAEVREALTNSEKFKIVGLTERYNDFVTSYLELNKFDQVVQPEPMNISRAPQLFDWKNEAVREILEPLVFADLKIYQSLAQP